MSRTQIAALIVPSQPGPSVSTGLEGLSASKPADVNPLEPIAGKSIYSWIVDAALAASVRRIGIVASNPPVRARSELAARSDDALIEFVTPMTSVTDTLLYAIERLGSELTLRDSTHILILPAEAPQIDSAELRSLVDRHIASGVAATLLATQGETNSSLDEPVVIRDAAGQIVSIVDADNAAPGILCVRASLLSPALHRAVAPRWQHGAPLAEIAAVLTEVGHTVDVVERDEPLLSIRSAATRVPIEMALRDRIVSSWIDRGVAMPDPRQVTIDATVTFGKGVSLLPGSVLEGATVVGDGAIIGPNTHVTDSVIGSRAIVPHCVVRGAEVPQQRELRPFSVVEAGTG